MVRRRPIFGIHPGVVFGEDSELIGEGLEIEGDGPFQTVGDLGQHGVHVHFQGCAFEVFTPTDFLAAITQHIPEPCEDVDPMPDYENALTD